MESEELFTFSGLQLAAVLAAIVPIFVVVLIRLLSPPTQYFTQRDLPGPKPTILFGTWWCAWKKFLGDEDLDNVRKYGKVYGTFDGLTPNLIVADPDLIKDLLSKEDKFHIKRVTSVKDPLLQQAVLALGSGEPTSVKNALAPSLSAQKMRKLVPGILKCVERFTSCLLKSAEECEGKVNVTEKVTAFLSEAVAQCVYGLDVEVSSEMGQQFLKNLSQAFRTNSPDSPFTLLLYLYASDDEFVLKKQALKFFSHLFSNVLEEKRKATAAAAEKAGEAAKMVDVTDLLIEAVEEEKALIVKGKDAEDASPSLTDEVLNAQVLAVVLNLSHATLSTVSLALHSLAAKPELQEKLHSELNKQIQSNNEVSFETVQNSEYLDMFIGEVLRMYPYELRLERVCSEETEFGKVKLDAGTKISVPVYALHHSEEFYPEPETFDPERFSPEKAEKRHPFAYLPFGQAGAGASSLSVQLSVLVAKVAVAALIKGISFTPLETETKMPPAFVRGITGVSRPEAIMLGVQPRK